MVTPNAFLWSTSAGTKELAAILTVDVIAELEHMPVCSQFCIVSHEMHESCLNALTLSWRLSLLTVV